MYKFFLLPLITCSLCSAEAQLALVRDPDGYTNIREGAGTHTRILDTVSVNRLIYVFGDEAEANWLPADYKKGGKNLSGYIHKSRIVFLTSLAAFKKTIRADTLLELRSDSMVITMSKKEFASKDNRITYERTGNGQSYVKLVNGKFPWGTDGNMPRATYKTIRYRSGKTLLHFPNSLFMDLFEPNLDVTSAYLEKATGKIFLEAANSDGAGSYHVVWIIQHGRIIHREIFTPF